MESPQYRSRCCPGDKGFQLEKKTSKVHRAGAASIAKVKSRDSPAIAHFGCNCRPLPHQMSVKVSLANDLRNIFACGRLQHSLAEG